MTTIQAGAEPRTAPPGGRGVRRSELTIISVISEISCCTMGSNGFVRNRCPIREMVRVIRDNMRAVRFGAIIREDMRVAKPRDYALGPAWPVQCARKVV